MEKLIRPPFDDTKSEAQKKQDELEQIKKNRKKPTRARKYKKKTEIIHRKPEEVIPAEMIEYGAIEDADRMGELYKIEWTIKYPHMTPYNYLTKIKLLPHSSAMRFLGHSDIWKEFKRDLTASMTKKLLDKHTDLIANQHENYAKGSNLLFGRILEMLNDKGTPKVNLKTGEPLKDSEGNPIYQPLKPKDIKDLTDAMRTSLDIYRKAMGIEENESVQQVVERISLTQVNVAGGSDPEAKEESKAEKFFDKLDYEDIQAMVKRVRELKGKKNDE